MGDFETSECGPLPPICRPEPGAGLHNPPLGDDRELPPVQPGRDQATGLTMERGFV